MIAASPPHSLLIDTVIGLMLGGLYMGVHIYIDVSLKRRKAAALAPPAPAPLGPGAVRITYRVTAAAAWRCESYTLTHHWQTALTLAGLPLLWFFLSLTVGVPAPADAMARLSLFYLGYFTLLGLAVGLQMRKRYPRPESVRVCTITLTATGYEDITPDRAYLVPWREVTDIRECDGDVFFWRGSRGNVVNREAFQDRRQALEFYAAAVALRQGRPADWPYAPAEDRACPPPPQAQ